MILLFTCFDIEDITDQIKWPSKDANTELQILVRILYHLPSTNRKFRSSKLSIGWNMKRGFPSGRLPVSTLGSIPFYSYSYARPSCQLILKLLHLLLERWAGASVSTISIPPTGSLKLPYIMSSSIFNHMWLCAKHPVSWSTSHTPVVYTQHSCYTAGEKFEGQLRTRSGIPEHHSSTTTMGQCLCPMRHKQCSFYLVSLDTFPEHHPSGKVPAWRYWSSRWSSWIWYWDG